MTVIFLSTVALLLISFKVTVFRRWLSSQTHIIPSEPLSSDGPLSLSLPMEDSRGPTPQSSMAKRHHHLRVGGTNKSIGPRVNTEDLSGNSRRIHHKPHIRIQSLIVNHMNVSIYFENYGGLNGMYGNTFANWISKKWKCEIPNGQCIFEVENKKADVIFKNTYIYVASAPPRYCDRQILAVLNSEAESRCPAAAIKTLHSADIKIDHHLSPHFTITEACMIPNLWKKKYKPPDPSKRKGVALFLSHCTSDLKWRNDYILELSNYIHLHSYGTCYHNVSIPSSRNNYINSFPSIARKHRMVVTFENTIEKDYISEKISLCYKSSVIPVYWGPPEIYQWVPGNHSFIDPQKFKGPKELAEYLKHVDEDDDLFRYHTTNFDFERTRKMGDKYCDDEPYMCKICKKAQAIKLSRMRDGVDPPTC